MADNTRINEDKLLAFAGLTRNQWLKNKSLLEKIRTHIEAWKKQNNINYPFDYQELKYIIDNESKDLKQ